MNPRALNRDSGGGAGHCRDDPFTSPIQIGAGFAEQYVCDSPLRGQPEHLFTVPHAP
ncbi:hypothetical protein ERY430_70079 [Erythrobacter sp. EC-HK427]|nr:hypothetical protein ERY430_70079 [Erythrobacter sp. EC-HK427]